jgi:hypothetical protein
MYVERVEGCIVWFNGDQIQSFPWTIFCQQETAKKTSNYATTWMLTCIQWRRHSDASILRPWNMTVIANKIILVSMWILGDFGNIFHVEPSKIEM